MNGTNRRGNHLGILAAACAVAFICMSAASALAETEPGWQIRFYAAAIDMDDGSSGATYGLDVGGGIGFNAEYRFTPRLGLDLGILAGAGVDIGTTWTEYRGWTRADTVTFTPLTAGLDIHLNPDGRVDVYACPMVALIQYGGLTVRTGPTGTRTAWDFDEDFAVGAGLGVGVPFGRDRWSFQASLTYLESSLNGNSDNGLSLDSSYDSTIFGFGFGYRFGQRAG